MTEVVQFVVGIFGRIVSGLFTTYIVRLVDKLVHKNDRHRIAVVFVLIEYYISQYYHILTQTV